MAASTKSADARSRAACDGNWGNVRVQPRAVGCRRLHTHDDAGSSAPAADTYACRVPSAVTSTQPGRGAESRQPYSHRRFPLAANAGQTTTDPPSVAPRTPFSGDLPQVAQLRKAGSDCRAALRLFHSVRVQPLFHAAIFAHSLGA